MLMKQQPSASVGHLSINEVRQLLDAVAEISGKRLAERNTLLIKVLFDGCLRSSEALSLRPCDMIDNGGYYRVRLLGKGCKPGEAAISVEVANEMNAYAYRVKLGYEEHFWPLCRRRVHQLMVKAFKLSGVRKPDRVGAVHVLRHTGALERLRKTGNPRSIQHQLRHADGGMTLRYMKTLEAGESMAIQEKVDLWD